jgi:hypothetical protein
MQTSSAQMIQAFVFIAVIVYTIALCVQDAIVN